MTQATTTEVTAREVAAIAAGIHCVFGGCGRGATHEAIGVHAGITEPNSMLVCVDHGRHLVEHPLPWRTWTVVEFNPDTSGDELVARLAEALLAA